MSSREVPAERATLKLEHFPACLCKHGIDGLNRDAKVIDTRCIAAYVVPESRRDREEAVLEAIAGSPADPAVERAESVLTLHQRLEFGSCLCGWSVLGGSFARHQAAALLAAGILA